MEALAQSNEAHTVKVLLLGGVDDRRIEISVDGDSAPQAAPLLQDFWWAGATSASWLRQFHLMAPTGRPA